MRVTTCIALFSALPSNAAAQSPAPFQPRELSAFERRKTEALLHSRYPCLGCHELNGTGGRIAPSLTSVAARRSPRYIHAMISDPQRTVPGTIMPRVPMRAATRDLIANYLAGPGRPAPDDPAPPAAADPPSPAPGDAPAVFQRFCAPCHGARGRGDGPNAEFLPVRPAALASGDRMAKRSDDALFDTIFSGGFVMNRSHLMPPFGATLARDQIRALVRHIRSLCRCEGPQWSRDNR